VYITVSDVRALSTSGGELVDLTPGIKPRQVDLRHKPSSPTQGCFVAAPLATTEVGTGAIPADNYQEIDLQLDPNGSGSAPKSNACDSGQCSLGKTVYNCVVDASENCHKLNLSSDSATGIPIPAAISFTGAPEKLAIDIDAGLSVAPSQFVHHQYDFKPNATTNLQAFLIGAQPVITGHVVAATLNGSTITPHKGSIVTDASLFLEQDAGSQIPVQGGGSNLVESVLRSTMTDNSGFFRFCPIPDGTYEIMADARHLPNGNHDPTDATIATGIDVSGSTTETGLIIPLIQQTGGKAIAKAESVIHTQNSTTTGDDVTFFGEQPFLNGSGDTVQALIPFFSANDPIPPITTTTADGTHPVPGDNCNPTGCNGQPNCACYIFAGPNGNPIIGTANTSGDGYQLTVEGNNVTYGIDARSNVHDASPQVCSPTQQDTTGFTIDDAEKSTSAPALFFNDCD
jgi:hypothetical protein